MNGYAKSKEVLTNPEVKARLEKLEHAVELRELQFVQADINEKHAKATRELIEAAKDTPNAVFLVGSILLVKVTDDQEPKLCVRTLAPEQMIYLAQNQHLLKSPADILDWSSQALQPSKSIPTTHATALEHHGDGPEKGSGLAIT